jgi:Leucine-rich repeat (LRR) protein
MKTRNLFLCAILFISLATTQSVKSAVAFDAVHFPDANFRAVITADHPTYVTDNYLSDDEISNIISIYAYNKSISDLTGIENFTYLESLVCTKNNLTNLNLSANTALKHLECSVNTLTSLNLSSNTNLNFLTCTLCGLTSLDLSANTALTYLDCSSNPLGTLNLTANTALTDITCKSDGLTTLTLGSKPALINLDCSSNSLTTLDLANCSAIEKFTCSSNPLGTFTQVNPTLKQIVCVSCNLTSLTLLPSANLKYLDCSSNSLSTLDVTQNTGLTNLAFCTNNLSSIDVSHNTLLTELVFWTNNLTAINVDNCPQLQYLRFNDNKITSLNLQNNTKLYRLQCANNKLSGVLDLSVCPGIWMVECETNQNITAVILPSVNTPLTWLDCGNNKITSIDLSHSPQLNRVTCSNNKINSLNLSANPSVTTFSAYNNGRTVKPYSYTRGSGYTGTDKVGYYIPLADQTGEFPANAIGKVIDLKGLATDVPFDLSKVVANSWTGATLGTLNGTDVLFLDTIAKKVTYKYNTGYTGTIASSAWGSDNAFPAPYTQFYLTWSPGDVITAVDGVENNDVNVFTSAGAINIGGSFNGNVNVYNLRGQQVYRGANSEIVSACRYVHRQG